MSCACSHSHKQSMRRSSVAKKWQVLCYDLPTCPTIKLVSVCLRQGLLYAYPLDFQCHNGIAKFKHKYHLEATDAAQMNLDHTVKCEDLKWIASST